MSLEAILLTVLALLVGVGLFYGMGFLFGRYWWLAGIVPLAIAIIALIIWKEGQDSSNNCSSLNGQICGVGEALALGAATVMVGISILTASLGLFIAYLASRKRLHRR